LSYTFIFRKQFYFVVSGLKIIGHGNPDNNLESPCILQMLCAELHVACTTKKDGQTGATPFGKKGTGTE
jgi:hypothetical protein